MPKDAKTILLAFAKAYEEVLGTDDFLALMERLTEFAKTETGAVLELQKEVNQNPQLFSDLLTEKSISEFKDLIVAAKSGNILGLLSGF